MAEQHDQENIVEEHWLLNHTRTGTLLIVEDDTPLRRLLCKVVTDASYRILEAVNAQQALQLAAAYSNPIDLLLTDVMIPGMRGPELMDRLRHTRPGVKVLFISGYDRALIGDRVRDPAVAFLPKPFTPQALLKGINKLMGGPETQLELLIRRYSASADKRPTQWI
ncbi:MAG TPA: response regulator [Bryobacteraceae bacterium]|jgi:two-component system cell cycle sensor histidine kinase/response regulator CckA|nr:response regulator [Bryobacteraceae bacterium]